ncbi:MAG: TetR/AcrR family transcriptional regulator [Acidimicrobiia bacterium]
MPRPFADEERTLLKQKLHASARQRIEQSGVRSMSVADLARQVGISKGAFYLLYESKDALVMEILDEVESEVRNQLVEVASDRTGSPTQVMYGVVHTMFEAVGGHPVLALLADPEEGPHIFRMVTPEQMAERVADDDRWFAELAAGLRGDGILADDVGDDILVAIARMALTMSRDPELVAHPRLIDVLCEALAARLAGDGG